MTSEAITSSLQPIPLRSTTIPSPKALLSARQAVAEYYRHRGKVNPESLVLTTSTSEGYSFVFRLLSNPEDEVLVPKPSYPLFEFLADLQDVKLVPYPLLYDHGWQIDFAVFPKSGDPPHPRRRAGASQQSHRLLREAKTSAPRSMNSAASTTWPSSSTKSSSTTPTTALYPVLCQQRRGPDLHPERHLKNLRPAANETGLDRRQRPRRSTATRPVAPGNHCRHLSLAERSRATGRVRH